MNIYSATLLLSLPLMASAQTNCSYFEVDYGSTWMNLTWTLNCNLSEEDIPYIRGYWIKLIDLTTGFYNFTLNDFCTDVLCTEYLDNVRPCIKYTIDLTVTLDDGTEHSYQQKTIEMKEEIPSMPQNLVVSGVAASNLTATWKNPKIGQYCVDHYEVCSRQVGGSGNYEDCVETVEPSVNIQGLTACTEYELIVKPVTKNGSEGLMSTVYGFTSLKTLGQPTITRPKLAGSDFVSFYWTPSPENINCIRGVSSSCFETEEQNIPRQRVTSENNPSVDDLFSEVKYLTACTNYYCSVEVTSSQENGWISSELFELSTSIIGLQLGEPQYVEHNAQPHELGVFWARPKVASRCVDSYYLSWGTDTIGYESISLSKDTFSHQIKDLNACLTYKIGVVAYTENFGQYTNGSISQIEATTSSESPGPVVNLLQTSGDGNSITMCWEPPIQNTYCTHDYRVEISFAGNNDLVNFKQEKTGDNECRNYEVQECARHYDFCVRPVTSDGKEGPQVCTIAESGPC